MTAVILNAGQRLWLDERHLLCPGERLDHFDPEAQAEMVRLGRPVLVDENEENE